MSHDIDAYDYQRYAILFVDDEANTRKYFRRLFSEKFRILEAEDGIQALEVFRQHADEIGIIVTDQRMPNETGVGFLSKIAAQYPDIIKILSTAYSDIDAAIGSVNQGGIFRYMTKPWDVPQLEVTLRRAMEFFTVKRERDALLGAKMQAMGNVLLAGRLASFALVPVAAKIPAQRVGEAIASFLRVGIAGRKTEAGSEADLRSPEWGLVHSRQLELAGALESALPGALSVSGIEARLQALANILSNAGASGVTLKQEPSLQISASSDPAPALLDTLLGRSNDPAATASAVQLLAAFIAVYDAGGSIRRVRGEGLTLEITTGISPKISAPGSETAKWLIDDEMLISAALGLI